MEVILTALSLPDPDGVYPDFRDYHERLGRALVQVIALSHRLAISTYSPDLSRDNPPPGGPLVEYPLATEADLRKIRSSVLNSQDDACPDLAQVGATAGNVWAWFRFLNVAEDADHIRPDDVAPGDPGMWVRQILPIGADCGTHRYIASIAYVSPRIQGKMLIERCRGKFPAVFISLASDDVTECGQTKAQHRIDTTYTIRILSANWRGGVMSRFEPPPAVERTSDPGAHRILGDIRRVLTMGYQLQQSNQMPPYPPAWKGCLGVETVRLQGMRESAEWDAERLVMLETSVRIIGYVCTSNTPCEIIDPWQMWIQLQDAMGNNAADEPPFQVTV
jgi:hypothetical protein